ncbi:hypothetical protein HPP92_009149 [Vanilla planifolia]|uniref:Phytocyanin domain-containing protein n=1 Tax=Vanilla planifolia TaxID=51239 RepID=A0A835R9R5_VANPL|nr:hypothetical protein HPP92_009149 [Vanilla planifolia]
MRDLEKFHGFLKESNQPKALQSSPGMFSDSSWSGTVFVYQPDQDSVVQVDKDAYNNCNTSSFISKFDDGNTVFTFTRSGSFYFVSGFDNNCKRNESLVVVVMADRSKTALGTNQSSPSPSPTPLTEAPFPPSPPPPTAPLSLLHHRRQAPCKPHHHQLLQSRKLIILPSST